MLQKKGKDRSIDSADPAQRVMPLMLAVCCVVGLVASLSACSKTPKEQMLAGFDQGCWRGDDPVIDRYCTCMHKGLDQSISAKVFNDPNADQGQLMRAFLNKAAELAPICKHQAEPNEYLR